MEKKRVNRNQRIVYSEAEHKSHACVWQSVERNIKCKSACFVIKGDVNKVMLCTIRV